MYGRIPGKGIAMFWASIHSVYVRIPSKGITMFWASIYSVYGRIPGKGIPMFRLAYIQCMLGSRVRGSPYIDSYGMMMRIPVKGVSKMG